MSTQFTLYALDEAAVPAARRFMRSSLGYGQTDVPSILSASAMESASEAVTGYGEGSRFAVFDSPSFIVDNDHTTFHDEGDDCVPHKLVDLIGPDLPMIDTPLAYRVVNTTPAKWAERASLAAWLNGARGRRLWYCFV